MGFVIPESSVTAIDDGVWVDYDNSSFLIAYASNARFLRIKQRLEQPYRRKIDAGTIDPVDQRDILVKAIAEGLLLDWKNVTNVNGEPAPFTKAAAIKALTYDEAFREFVMETALNLQNFKDSDQEVLGN